MSRDNGVGFLTLNRPSAINSLNYSMVMALQAALAEWEHDEAIDAVVLSGAGQRGLCAGGDVIAFYHSARGDGSAARRFWYDEYLLNAHISRYSKPYVALMAGIVMGGGVGVAAHASVCVVTESSKVAMPEVSNGCIPDVGGTCLLARVPGLLGLHAALPERCSPVWTRSRWASRTARCSTNNCRPSLGRLWKGGRTRQSARLQKSDHRVALSRSVIGSTLAMRGGDCRRHRRSAARPRRQRGQ